MFCFGTHANKADANVEKCAIGTDIWALFPMSGIVPERVSGWFETWQEIWCSREMSPMFKSTQVRLRRNPRQTNSPRLGRISWQRHGEPRQASFGVKTSTSPRTTMGLSL